MASAFMLALGARNYDHVEHAILERYDQVKHAILELAKIVGEGAFAETVICRMLGARLTGSVHSPDLSVFS
jgi:hypothetical protein